MDGNNKQHFLEETPTWAVSVVCFILILLSLLIEHGLHRLTKFLNRGKRNSLNQAIGKIKTDLMIMGFMSLVLTASEVPVSRICVSKAIGNSFLPCNDPLDSLDYAASVAKQSSGSNTTLSTEDGYSCEAKGMISLISRDGIMQLRIFIFVLAAFHVLYCVLTMCLGIAKVKLIYGTDRSKDRKDLMNIIIQLLLLLFMFLLLLCYSQMRRWERWEEETQTLEYEIENDPRRFRFMRQTSFGRRHLKFWSDHPLLLWPACFLRQFSGSVTKADYCTLRNGFIVAHFSKSRDFDFQRFLARAFDSDFVQVVGISLWVWIFSIFFIFFSAQGFYNHFWLPFIPLVMVLTVGAKLEVIITKMCLESPNKTAVVRGSFLVRPNDDLFWFGQPQWLLYVIHFILFQADKLFTSSQNSFQLAFFTWTWYEYGLKSCFHQETVDITLRIVTGAIVQFLCGYVTLPLYALVTQMGSGMKSAIFTERVAKGLKQWHNLALQHLSKNKPISTIQSSEPWPSDTTEKSLSDLQELGSPKHNYPPPLSVTSSVTPKSSDTTEKPLSKVQELGSPKHDHPPPLSLKNYVTPESSDKAVKNKVITREANGEISFGRSWKELGSGKTIIDITSVQDEVWDVNCD